jgi:hypothetical protein
MMIIAVFLAAALSARAAEDMPNPFDTNPPWTGTQIEILLGKCRKPTLKELKGRWLQVAALTPETNGPVYEDKIYMNIMRDPDSDDDQDYIAVIEAPKALDAEQKKAKGGGRAVDANMRYRVNMDKLKDAADIMHTLVRAGIHIENQCKISEFGRLLCRGVQAQAGSEPTLTYTGFVKATPKSKR